MHSRIFNVLPIMKDYNKADENDVFEYMAGRADYVEEINTPKEIEEEMTYLLQVLKKDLPHVKLHKDSKGHYNLLWVSLPLLNFLSITSRRKRSIG